MELKLLAIGEAMAELRQSDDGNFNVGFAGDTVNTAIYCARALAATDTVGFMSRVGVDPLSQSFLDFASKEKLDISHISCDYDHNIGIYSVSTDRSGERSFHYWRDTSAARKMFLVEESVRYIPKARITYLSGITLAILHPAARRRLLDCLKESSSAGNTLIAFDSNYRRRLWESEEIAKQIISEMWEIADIALPSIDDEIELFGDTSEQAVISRFSKRSWAACAIKRGVRGPVSPNLIHKAHPHFPPAETVVDTTAAGDSFNGAYLAAFIVGKSPVDCLSAGHSCASRVVGFRGAIVPTNDS